MTLTLATIRPGEPEIFAAPQGEGPSAGLPCVFIRLSRCNLACWWCDTAYTWRFEGDNRPHRDETVFKRKAEQVVLEEEDAAARIAMFARNRLVITGGEPLLQGAALARMLAQLPDLHVEIETNGTVEPHASLDPFVDQYNVSPKLEHSGNPGDLALVPERLAAWAADPRAWFKFVVCDPADLAEVLGLQRRHAILARRIQLMPEGHDAATLRDRRAWLEPLCEEHGYKFTDRLHIHLYGDTRGT
ncbi:MAG: 7-carboxy-7-deazaguanine synthase QueE [Alphaproteobacteria bacterium]|nr:7-carboxy-7-deazaguanine synthase QueE [Alphaproteobacteria bacterium]